MEKILGVITSTNPDPQTVRETLKVLRPNIVGVVISDNNSRPEIKQGLMALAKEFPGFVTFSRSTMIAHQDPIC